MFSLRAIPCTFYEHSLCTIFPLVCFSSHLTDFFAIHVLWRCVMFFLFVTFHAAIFIFYDVCFDKLFLSYFYRTVCRTFDMADVLGYTTIELLLSNHVVLFCLSCLFLEPAGLFIQFKRVCTFWHVDKKFCNFIYRLYTIVDSRVVLPFTNRRHQKEAHPWYNCIVGNFWFVHITSYNGLVVSSLLVCPHRVLVSMSTSVMSHS